jgi:putative ABC transport system permease protein
MRLSDTISLAYRTIRGNRLKTGLTVAIIAFGIMALVGINTAIDAMKQKMTESFFGDGGEWVYDPQPEVVPVQQRQGEE